MPDLVTHRYDPALGVCPDICSLTDSEAERVLDQLRRTSRPTLKPTYLTRRRSTERWLSEQACEVLGRPVAQGPVYCFLGDFSHTTDPSRPAALLVPLSALPANTITFTLDDSMTVAEQTTRRVYSLAEISAMFADGGSTMAEFGWSDRDGFPKRFIEVQVWDRTVVSKHHE